MRTYKIKNDCVYLNKTFKTKELETLQLHRWIYIEWIYGYMNGYIYVLNFFF